MPGERLVLRPADVIFVRSPGLLGEAIRWGENGGAVSHVAMYVGSETHDGHVVAEVAASGEPLRSDLPYAAQSPNIVEANHSGVERKSILEYCDNDYEVAIYRLTTLTDEQRAAAVAHAIACLGRPYGFGKLAAVLLDEKVFGGRTVFRALTTGDGFPDCSVLVAEALAHGSGYVFPFDRSGGAEPSHMLQACELSYLRWCDRRLARADARGEWYRIKPLGRLSHEELG